MNANELADKLKLFWHTENDNLFDEAATMLRQQQAEIEALKTECNWAKDQWNKDRICFEHHKKVNERDYNFMKDLAIGEEARAKELEAKIEALKGEVAQLKHMNKNWSISEGWALQEIEMLKHFLKANELYLSYTEWKHSDAAIKVAEDTMK